MSDLSSPIFVVQPGVTLRRRGVRPGVLPPWTIRSILLMAGLITAGAVMFGPACSLGAICEQNGLLVCGP